MIFDMYEEYDGDIFERMCRGPFKGVPLNTSRVRRQ